MAGLFIVRDYSNVCYFLKHHSFLLPILEDAHRAIQRVFGAATPVALEMFHDREFGGAEELFALIQSQLDPETAVQKLAVLNDQWWTEASIEAKCSMNMDVEFAA